MGRPRSWTDTDLIAAHAQASCLSDIARYLGLAVGSSHVTIKRHLARLGMSVPILSSDPCAYSRRYWAKHRAKKANHDRVYRSKNQEKYRQYARNRRARKAGAPGSFTAEEFAGLCAQYDNKCLCCGEYTKLTADHVIPLSKGGTNCLSNIQPLCGPCNSKKHASCIDYRSAS